MHTSTSSLALGLLAIFVTIAAAFPGSTVHLNKEYTEERNGVQYAVFEHANTGAKMSYVNNSGICETTQGVNQYSGYISIGNNMNMFFWYNRIITVSLVSYFPFLLLGLVANHPTVSGSSKPATAQPQHLLRRGSTAVPDVLP